MEHEWLLRVICAAAVGGMIGFERHNHLKEAGIRTHAIVAMGAAVVMIISKYGFTDVKAGDPARLAAQVVSGVGFLGAGIIFVRHNIIQGMATAAGIWTTSAIGLAFGAGMYGIGGATGLLVVLIQIFFQRKAVRDLVRTDVTVRLTMKPEGSVRSITKAMIRRGYTVTCNRIFRKDESQEWILESDLFCFKDMRPSELMDCLKELENVVSAEYIDPSEKS